MADRPGGAGPAAGAVAEAVQPTHESALVPAAGPGRPAPLRIRPLARERRQTLHLLAELRGVVPVFLDTEVDMTAVREHREAARRAGSRYSIVSYVLSAAGRALAEHPEANAAVRGRLHPRVARYPRANGKVTLDKVMNGRRVVLSAVLPGTDTASLDEIQRGLEDLRDADPDTAPRFAPVRALQRLPVPAGRLAFRARARPLRRRPDLLGTYSVTSLGHGVVDGFHSVGGTTATFGVGRIRDRPVVRDGLLSVAPVMRLNLAFDHRVIDGAEAADLLADVQERLETRPAG
ncbi:MAG TPA: 2-oxo acid dehydrogenase subunit E2 [Actinocrinis sp.]|jgi:pyruvate/2-oxoglutarate dehydrogenase complex dihydrolipoamide acyltransferase (E2) component